MVGRILLLSKMSAPYILIPRTYEYVHGEKNFTDGIKGRDLEMGRGS